MSEYFKSYFIRKSGVCNQLHTYQGGFHCSAKFGLMEVFMHKQLILKSIDAMRESMVQDLLDLISIPSLSHDKEKVVESLEWVLNRACSLGLHAYSVLDNQVGVVELGEGAETIGILVHVDVVGVDENEVWDTPPFAGTVVDNFIKGRGTIDDKGPVMACLYAMKAVLDLELPLHKKIQMIIGTQEETEWVDMEAFVEKYPLPDYGFTPDGAFPITNREKGYADIELRFGGLTNAESEGEGESTPAISVHRISGGQAVNSVPSFAEASVYGPQEVLESALAAFSGNEGNGGSRVSLRKEGETFVIAAHGASTHSSLPHKGINAIAVLCSFLKTLSIETSGAVNLVNLVADRFADDIYGKNIGLYSEDEYLNGEYIHRNVISPTLVHCDGDECRLTLNIRTAYGTFRPDLDRAFTRLSEEYGCSFSYISYKDPILLNKNQPFLSHMADAYEEVSGFTNDFCLEYGTTYAKAMPNITVWGPLFPTDTDYCHERNERISVESFILSAKVYASALARMALSQESLIGKVN